jgi:hypothetical protein
VLKEKGGGAVWAGGETSWASVGRKRALGERPTAWEPSRAEREGLGRLWREERGEGEGFLFLKILFKFVFQTFKLQPNRNPCIRIMMHKHLLFLNYFSDV